MVRQIRGIPLGGWGLALTKPGQDRVARDNLENQHVRCFMPRVRMDRKANESRKLAPLFPGYLFFQVPHGDWGFIRNTRGVRDMLYYGDKPATVPPTAMRALLLALNEENYLDLTTVAEPIAPLVPGEHVSITKGVFKNFAGVYKALAPGDRIRVITEFFGQAREVELERSAVIRLRRTSGVSNAGAVATQEHGSGTRASRKTRDR